MTHGNGDPHGTPEVAKLEKADAAMRRQAEVAPADASGGFGMSAMGPPTPWPAGHAPRTRGEVRLWLSFAFLRVDRTATLDVKLVATRIGMSRTAIAYDGCTHKVLRAAVLDEISRRAETKAADEAATGGGRPSAGAPARGVRYWQAIAQRADSRLCDFKAIAVREQMTSRRTRELLRRVLDDMRAGRWARVDMDAVMIADIAAELDMAERKVRARD